MCLSEDMGIQIYYQDTDSMHIPRDDVSSLASAFQAKYNRELIGNQLGHFHNDFAGGPETQAVESYFIWKKAYIDKLSNGSYHKRLKGIPEASLDLVAERSFGNNPMKLYEHLYEGRDITFDLLETGVRFTLTPGYIATKNKFTRKVRFTQ